MRVVTGGDVDTRTEAFFERVLGEFRCDRCATEFTIGSAFGSMSHKSLTCPVCDADEEDITRLSDTEPAEVSA